MVDVWVGKTAPDERLLVQVVVPEMAGPADVVRDVRARLVGQERGEEQRVALLDLYGDGLGGVYLLLKLAVAVGELRVQQAPLVAAGYDLQRPRSLLTSTSGTHTTIESSEPCMLRQSWWAESLQ